LFLKGGTGLPRQRRVGDGSVPFIFIMMKKSYVVSILAAGVFLFSCLQPASSTGSVTEKKDYWDNGKVKVCKKYSDLGDPVETSYYRENGTLEQREKYDAYGHKVEEAYYGSDGKLRENSDGWAAIRNQYKDGKLAIESYYGADGRLKERKQYNKLGDLVARQYVGDGDPLPAEEFNPIPTLAGETTSYYDSYGRPEGSTSIIRDDEWWRDRWGR